MSSIQSRHHRFLYAMVILCAGFVVPANAREPGRSGGPPGAAFSPVAGFSSEPRLVSGGKIDFPAVLIKKGVTGTVEVSVTIDQEGRVEECTVDKGVHPVLDSLVLAAMRDARFTPAYESGNAVPARVSLQLDFDLATILANSSNASPELCGVVIDRSTKKPVGGAMVSIECLDSLADPDITVAHGRYLELIGTIPGQSWYRGIISTAADSFGAFSLRLLPGGPVRIAVTAQGYEPAHFTQQIRPGIMKSAIYHLDPLAIMEGDSIIVYGRTERSDVMDIEEQQYVSGLTTYLSDMLKSQTAITGNPEAASLMTARGGSPYDNRYLICGVPFLSPFHFGGHPYADVDGLMISSLKKVTVTTDRIAARFPDVSGILIEADPGIYRSENKHLVRRPELAVDYGSLTQEVMLSVPLGTPRDDFFQLGYSGSKDFYFRCKAISNEIMYTQITGGPPLRMGNVTLSTTKTGSHVQADAFGWFAWDTYQLVDSAFWHDLPLDSQKTFFPWGMASIGLHPPGKPFPLVRYGASHQYIMQGKRVGMNAFLKTVYLSNGSVSLFLDTLKIHDLAIQVDCRLDEEHWHGTVIQRDTFGLDTSVAVSGNDLTGSIHGSAEQRVGPFLIGADLLGSLHLYAMSGIPDPVLDAGISCTWESGPFQAGLHAGRITSRPDIRGLPDSLFRRKHVHAWVLSLPIFFNGDPTPIRLSVQPYLRYQDRVVGMNPLLYTWDDDLTTPLQGEGVDLSAELLPVGWFAWECAVNLSRAVRLDGDALTRYEFNAPWTVRNNLHLNYKKRFHVYLKGILTRLAPYYDFSSYSYEDLPLYMRWDINLQYRTERPQHRYLTRYDGYFNIKNLTESPMFRNTRDYYWDERMNKHPIYMSTWIMELGLRAGFRL